MSLGTTDIPASEKIVDTTGAGDAFLGLISKLISSGYPSNELEIQDCIKFASACGLLTCLVKVLSSHSLIMKRLINF